LPGEDGGGDGLGGQSEEGGEDQHIERVSGDG
jgi:hypothetical protein